QALSQQTRLCYFRQSQRPEVCHRSGGRDARVASPQAPAIEWQARRLCAVHIGLFSGPVEQNQRTDFSPDVRGGVGGLAGGRNRRDEHNAGQRDGTNTRNWGTQSDWSETQQYPDAISDRSGDVERARRNYWRDFWSGTDAAIEIWHTYAGTTLGFLGGDRAGALRDDRDRIWHISGMESSAPRSGRSPSLRISRRATLHVAGRSLAQLPFACVHSLRQSPNIFEVRLLDHSFVFGGGTFPQTRWSVIAAAR